MAAASSLVEGPYKNFRIRFITPTDYSSVLENISAHFVYDDIVNQLLGIDEDYKRELGLMCQVVLEENMSLLAEDAVTGEISGLRLNYVKRRGENIFGHLSLSCPQIAVLFRLFGELDEQAAIFERFPSISSYGCFFLASTTPAYRNQGLAKEFYARALNYFRVHLQLKLAKVYTSSPFTQAATKSLGFEEVGRIDFGNVVDPLTKEKVFKEEQQLTPEHFVLVKIYHF